MCNKIDETVNYEDLDRDVTKYMKYDILCMNQLATLKIRGNTVISVPHFKHSIQMVFEGYFMGFYKDGKNKCFKKFERMEKVFPETYKALRKVCINMLIMELEKETGKLLRFRVEVDEKSKYVKTKKSAGTGYSALDDGFDLSGSRVYIEERQSEDEPYLVE